MQTLVEEEIRENVKEYYGKVLNKSSDLKTNACCTTDGMSKESKELISAIHEEVRIRYYGCGLIHPPLLEGMEVLDLGSGSGRDVFILSKLVGEKGHVTGVDMTDKQLEVANKYIEYHTRLYGYGDANVTFKKGYIELLRDVGFEDNSFDIIVSNCVVNLSPNKEAVLREVYRVLKPGGELYFSDVYSDRRIPPELAQNPVLYGECLGGALYKNDFLRLARETGFNDPRIIRSNSISINNKEVQDIVGNTQFESITFRLFKVPQLEDTCEDYGQAVTYKGTIPGCPDAFDLDDHHHFEKGRAILVCGNTYLMLKESRFSPHFLYFGDMGAHLGLFKGCGSPSPNPETASHTDTYLCCG